MREFFRLSAEQYRTVWISDVHLGFRGCNAEHLLEFLRATDCEQLYLVGDIIDFLAMQRRVYWPASHSDVLHAILEKARNGTRVMLVPGNHDELLRKYDGLRFSAIRIRNRALHTGADGRRYLIVHGDEFDAAVRCSPLIALFGKHAYDLLIRLSNLVHQLHRAFGMPYWSLAKHVKHRVTNALQYIGRFEEAVAREAQRLGFDGVVCGHIHHAALRTINGTLYSNCGDWVESCTALVEHRDGSLEVIHWAELREARRERRLPSAA